MEEKRTNQLLSTAGSNHYLTTAVTPSTEVHMMHFFLHTSQSLC